jgi:hypothetical protein
VGSILLFKCFKFRNPCLRGAASAKAGAFRNTLSPSNASVIFFPKVDILSILKLTSEFYQTLLIN